MKRILSALVAMTLLCASSGCDKDKADEKASDSKSLYDSGIEIISVMEEMTESDDYIGLYSVNDEIQDYISKAAEGDYTEPLDVYKINLSFISLMSLSDFSGADDLPDNLKNHLEKQSYASISSRINAMAGAKAVAASSLCKANKIFVDKNTEESMIYLYTYENASPVIVVFTAGENGAVYGEGTFIFNEELKTDTEDDVKEFFSEFMATAELIEK